MMKIVAILVALSCIPVPAVAQVTGSASVMFDIAGSGQPAAGSEATEVTEARARIVVEARRELGTHWRLNLAGHVDGLIADRLDGGVPGPTRAAIVRPLDTYVEYASSRFELRAGASRVTWGRLDELQPTDVVNPIDLTRFLLEGRSEARLAVGLVRTRFFATPSTTIEAVVVPFFRASSFDQLDEGTSPFNLLNGFGGSATSLDTARDAVSVSRTARDPPYMTEDSATQNPPYTLTRAEPERDWNNVQGGVRLTSTIGTFDWGLSGYRGFRTFPVISLVTPVSVVETFPRFTMIGGDFETVRGEWGIRGEVAVFADDARQSTRLARAVSGRSIEGGIGIDRKAGDYRLAANVLWSWWGTDPTDTYAPLVAGDPELERTDFSIVMAADRSFARETRTLRVFAVYDPADATAFARVIGSVSLRDNLWLEGSGGLFGGEAPDTIGRLTRRDFLYARVKVFF